jgi:NAD(P)-dependent dehydrogenase (short-subunit alcohol dehydrogenase family)
MAKRNATAAIIGAGDYIGTEIAKKFAAEGFTVFAGRRNGDKLAPLVNEVQAAGGTIFARSLDARKEEEITAFLGDADKEAPLEVCIFNVGANVSRSSRPPSGCFARFGRWPAIQASWPDARPRA